MVTGDLWAAMGSLIITLLLLCFFYVIWWVILPYVPVRDGKVYRIPDRGDVIIPVRISNYFVYRTFHIDIDGVRAASLRRGKEVMLPVPSGPVKISIYAYNTNHEYTMDIMPEEGMAIHIWIKYDEKAKYDEAVVMRATHLNRGENFDESEIRMTYRKSLKSDSWWIIGTLILVPLSIVRCMFSILQ